VELVSNLQLGLGAAVDKDDELYQSLSDRDDSSVEGGGPGQAAAAREATPAKPLYSEPRKLSKLFRCPLNDPPSVLWIKFASYNVCLYPTAATMMTLEHMLEMSKNLIGSIKENLREFTEKNQNSMIPDDITHHRRPNSAGNLSSQARMQAMQMRASSGEDAFFEGDDDEAYDPNDYAFTRSRPTTAPRSPGEDSATGDEGTAGSPSRNPRITALLMQQKSQLTGAASWPTKRTLLNSMESIICGDLFVVDFYWVPQHTTTELIAKYYVSK
jgi:hypothetical protein